MKFTLAGRCVECKNIKYQHRAVDDAHVAEYVFNVAYLGGREFLVENHDVYLVVAAKQTKFVNLAFAYKGRRIWRGELLRYTEYDLASGGVNEPRQFVERNINFVRLGAPGNKTDNSYATVFVLHKNLREKNEGRNLFCPQLTKLFRCLKTFLKSVNTAAGIDKFLLAGVERMAL